MDAAFCLPGNVVVVCDENDGVALLMKIFEQDLVCTGRYHFAQSVIYEFALSGYDDFDEFISSME